MSVAAHASTGVREMAEAARRASRVLATLSEDARNAALEAMAVALEGASAELMAANAEDLQIAGSMRGEEALAPATMSRLKLTDAKLREMVEQVRSVKALPDPLGRTLDAIELDDQDPSESESPKGLHLQKIAVPLGVLAVIFEARPDAVTQIASLALKSGNAVLMKPGREVEKTATALVRVLRAALVQVGLPAEAIELVLGRERVAEVLGLHGLVDMVIPRGSKALVEHVQANTRIPVLGHSEGICHIYVDRDVNE
jgi:glutamate-5-semialdehyde dehydrogenase